VLLDDQSDAGHHQNAENPEVPCHHERDEIIESNFGPLIKTAFQRRQAIDEDDYGSQRQIESDDGEQPKYHLGVAQLGRPADPDSADDKDNLSEDQIEETELLLQGAAACFDGAFDGGQ